MKCDLDKRLLRWAWNLKPPHRNLILRFLLRRRVKRMYRAMEPRARTTIQSQGSKDVIE